MNKNEIKELIQKSILGRDLRKETIGFPIKFSIKNGSVYDSAYDSAWYFVYRKIREPIRERMNNIRV